MISIQPPPVVHFNSIQCSNFPTSKPQSKSNQFVIPLITSESINQIFTPPFNFLFCNFLPFLIQLPQLIKLFSLQNHLYMTYTAEFYLSKIQKLSSKPQIHERVKLLNSTLLDGIDNQIIQSRIIIPQHQKKLNIKAVQNDPGNQAFRIDDKYNQIKQKKKALLQELQAVESIENTIKKNRSTIKQSSVSTHMGKNSKIRSQFTQEEHSKIKEIYRNQKKFERKLQAKTKKYEENLECFKKEKQEQERQKYRKLCMQKHEEREKYINEIQIRNHQRQEMLNQQREKIIELKNKQKLFQKLQQNFLQEKQLESEQLKRRLNEHKKRREFSFDDMKRHQEEYMQRKRAKDQQRQQNIRNFKNINQAKFPCLFLDKIKEKQEQEAFQKEEKRQIIQNFAERKTAYAQEVRKQLHNKIKTMSESKLSSIKQTKIEPKWMNTPQKYHQGTKYMREVNSKISQLPRKAVQKSGDENKPKFKNYLTELKNQDQDKKEQAKKKNVNKIISDVSIISAKENITATNLTKSVKAKLELIKKLQNLQ